MTRINLRKVLSLVVIFFMLTACDSGDSGSDNSGSDESNSPPTISAINDQNVLLGEAIVPIDLLNYIDDNEDDPRQLKVTITSQSNSGAINCYLDDLWVKSNSSLCSGTNRVTITVEDPRGYTAGSTFEIKVEPPPLAYTLVGLNFSPYVNDQDPNDNILIPKEQIRQRMEIIAPYTKWIRTFGSTNGLEEAAGIARQLDLKIAMGAWLDKNDTTNQEEIMNLIEEARNNRVDCAIVGSEVLLRGDMTENKLIDYIKQVKNAVPWIPVTYGGSYSELLNHTDVVEACDIVLANYYPYWEGIAMEEAITHLHAQHRKLSKATPGKEIWVSETGWPSDGETIDKAVPTLQNACYYFLNFISWARAENVNYFYFEALDEPWKQKYEGNQGAHWGIWNENGILKNCMDSVFQGSTVDNNWSDTFFIGDPNQPPQIEMTHVPPMGSFSNLQGRAFNLRPGNYDVAVYIKVGAGWWTKPYWDNPVTLINGNGTWICNITTGAGDSAANEIAAFLIPTTYTPPLIKGGHKLPNELYSNSVDHQIVTR